jgi:hypothetical protein
MASTTTPLIGLFKATPGTNEPFRTSDINNNWDTLDTFIVGYQVQFDELAAENATALANFNATANGSLNEFTDNSSAALDEFSDSQAELDAAIASLDTAAILEELELGFAIDGGTA